MRTAAITEIYAKVEDAGNRITMLYAEAVGKFDGLDTNKEFSLLIDWRDSIKVALKAARSIDDHEAVKKFKDEQKDCQMWLDYWGGK